MIINDIHSYAVFANIDKQNGKIEGHQVVLPKEAFELIEDIVISYWKDKPEVRGDAVYEVVKD